MQTYTLLNTSKPAPLFLSVEHAGNSWPEDLPPPVSAANWQAQHYAYDRGIAGMATLLADRLGCPLLMGQYTRLLVDLNRMAEDTDLIATRTDGLALPGNILSPAQQQARIARYYRPYHTALAALQARCPLQVSLHSFTRQRASDSSARPWDVGILYTRASPLSRLLCRELQTRTGFCVGDNQPYDISGARCPIGQAQAGVEVEICDDLLTDKSQQALWATLLADILASNLTAVTAEASCPACD